MTEGRPRGERAVTVLLACRDRLEFLRDAVESALAQEHPDLEVLVVDDGSGPETRQWLASRAAQDARLRLVRQEGRGVGAARRLGVEEARGELICILDSDDVLQPRAVQRLAQELERDPEIDLVYTDNYHLFPGGEMRPRRYPAYGSSRAMTRAVLLSPRVPFKHSGTMFRRSVALRLGSYDADLPCKIDVDFFLKLLAAGCRLRRIGEPLVTFRVHGSSISRDRSLGIRAWFELIDRYGPRNGLLRLALKAWRAAFEGMKRGWERLAWLSRGERAAG